VDYSAHYDHTREQAYTIVEFDGFTLTEASFESGGIDTEAYSSRAARVSLPLRADITGVTIRASVWATQRARTNLHSTTYFTTGSYYQAAAITGAYLTAGQVFSSDVVPPPVFQFASTNFVANQFHKSWPAAGINHPFIGWVDNDILSEQEPRYWGAMLHTGPVVITWGFLRCTN
jgi:hypothetical protein